MKILVTGAKGQLGFDVVKRLAMQGHEVVGTDIDDVDITDKNAVLSRIESVRPEAVIHCAAYTAVDAAEDNAELCQRINVEGTENIAVACKKFGIKMMYFSTDYVFSGLGDTPWKPDDIPFAQSVYGKTKLAGENAVTKNLDSFFIIRISWVFGINGKNFVKTMLRLSENHDKITVVNDQIGSPTYTHDLAKLVAEMIVTDKYGIYHATNEGFCSWYQFAREIFNLTKKSAEVLPISTVEYSSRAKRPLNSRLDKSKLSENGFTRLPSWQNALKRYLTEIEALQ